MGGPAPSSDDSYWPRGMSAKFHECTLAQMYREVDADGTVHGGPMYYLSMGPRIAACWLALRRHSGSCSRSSASAVLSAVEICSKPTKHGWPQKVY